MNTWTQFYDMSSGGQHKLAWSVIYIEAELPDAERIFVNRFGIDPHDVTCECCGEDYSVTPVDAPVASCFDDRTLIVYAADITTEERR